MKSRDRQNCGFIYDLKYPSEFNFSDIDNWPSVRSGYLKEQDAEKILKKYIEV